MFMQCTTFTCHVPDNIIKPKPEDWGTFLCQTCLTPELKLSATKQQSNNQQCDGEGRCAAQRSLWPD